MRVGFVCRGLDSASAIGPGAQALATAHAIARLGHEAVLISESLSDAVRDRLGPVRWTPVLPERPRHWYFTRSQSYADRVYDTLRDQPAFDVVECAGAGGEALTTVRAKRLLGCFPGTCLVVDSSASPAVDPGAVPVSFVDSIGRYAERYVRDHADLVIAAGRGDATELDGCAAAAWCPPVLGYPGALPPAVTPAAATPPIVLWLGTLRPGSGLRTLLRAGEHVLRDVPDLQLVLCGEDTPTDPFGRSYADYLRGRLAPALRNRVAFAGPPRLDGPLPAPAGTPCVLPAGPADAPAATLVAMAAGWAVIAPSGSHAAGSIRAGETGQVVPRGSARALGAALVEAIGEPGRTAARARAAAAQVRAEHDPLRAAALRVAAYERARRLRRAPRVPRPRTRDRVSVVIPVRDQGRFLAETVASVRSGAGGADLDIVVVDDGSTDPATLVAIDRLADVTALRQDHRGVAAARNTGIAAARGEFLLNLDADDLVHPGFLPAALAALHRCPDLTFVAGYARYFGLLDLTYVPVGPVPQLNLVLQTQYKSMGFYRRAALEKIGGYDEEMPAFEDWEIQLRLAAAGYRSDILPIEGQQYRRHADSMSFTSSNGMRGPLVQYLVRKHAGILDGNAVELIQVLVDLWKSGYEPSTSVLLQRGMPT